MYDFRKDPRYQRGLASRLQTEESPYTGDIAGAVTGDVAANSLMARQHADRMALEEKGLGLNRERLNIARDDLSMRKDLTGRSMELEQNKLDYAGKQSGIATAIAGGNLLASAYSGLMEMKRTDEILGKLGEMRSEAAKAGDIKSMNQIFFLEAVLGE